MGNNFNDFKLTRTEDREVKEEIIRIVREHAPITVRGVYYQCVLSPKLPFLSKDSSGQSQLRSGSGPAETSPHDSRHSVGCCY